MIIKKKFIKIYLERCSQLNKTTKYESNLKSIVGTMKKKENREKLEW